MATIRDVAQLAQVSVTTVSRVLNRDESISVSSEARIRIFQAAHTLGYLSPRQKKEAERKQRLVVGVADWQIIRPDRVNVRLSSLACLVQMMSARYDVQFCRLTLGCPQKVDGVVAFGSFNREEMDYLYAQSYAIVFINSNQTNYEHDQVQVDFDRGLEQLAAYLTEHKQYGSVGYIGGVYENGRVSIGHHRLDGLTRVLKRRGLYDPALFHVGEISQESGYRLAMQAFREKRLARAVLLGSDEVAEGALEAFEELGLHVPGDVAVVVYQDLQTLQSKWPTGTCLEVFPDYLWQNALELLLGRIAQKRSQSVTVTVPPLLRPGDTA